MLVTGSSAFAELDTAKINKIFPDTQIMSQKEILDGYYEVQLKPKEVLFKRSAIYTNESVDFVTGTFMLVDGEKTAAPTPDYEYNKIDLEKHATFTTGEGESRFVFINPLSEDGYAALKEILEAPKFSYYVYLQYDKKQTSKDVRVIQNLMLPVFRGDNEKRVANAQTLVKQIADIYSRKLSDKQARELSSATKKEIDVLLDKNDTETEQFLKAFYSAMELSEIFAEGKSHYALDKDKKDVTPEVKAVELEPAIKASGVIKSQPQELTATFNPADYEQYQKLYQHVAFYYNAAKEKKSVKYYNFKDVEGFTKLVEDSTAYTLGNGENEYLLFTDIECPFCVQLETAYSQYLDPNAKVRILYLPYKPNSLDKNRHVLMTNEADRHQLADRIRGQYSDGLESKQAISNLSESEIKAMDKVLGNSMFLSQLFQVVGTPTLMKVTDGVLTNVNPYSITKK